MRTSQEIDKISEALAKAQAEMKNPEKNQTAKIPTKAGGSYSYNYADLPHTLDTIRGPLAKYGLSHTSGIESHAAGMILSVRLMHQSGQWLESDIGFPTSHDPKTAAANITYFRRYLLTALVGIAADDDMDSEPETPESSYAPRKQAQPVKSSALNEPVRGKPTEFDQAPSNVVSGKVGYANWPTEKLEAHMTEMLSRLSAKGLSAADLTGDGKTKFEAVQQELTRRGNAK